MTSGVVRLNGATCNRLTDAHRFRTITVTASDAELNSSLLGGRLLGTVM
jgi:hypothetical protein